MFNVTQRFSVFDLICLSRAHTHMHAHIVNVTHIPAIVSQD